MLNMSGEAALPEQIDESDVEQNDNVVEVTPDRPTRPNMSSEESAGESGDELFRPAPRARPVGSFAGPGRRTRAGRRVKTPARLRHDFVCAARQC